jgi:hypothetical protein
MSPSRDRKSATATRVLILSIVGLVGVLSESPFWSRQFQDFGLSTYIAVADKRIRNIWGK